MCSEKQKLFPYRGDASSDSDPNHWTMKHSWWEEKVLFFFSVSTNKLHPYITNYGVNSPNHNPSIHATKYMQRNTSQVLEGLLALYKLIAVVNKTCSLIKYL